MRRIHISETSRIPWLGIVLGFGSMAPLAAGAMAAWLCSGPSQDAIIKLTAIWAGSILAFLAGVRRGLSFRTEGGPSATQIATMSAGFILALGSILAVAEGWIVVSIGATLAGFVMISILDPVAARQGEVPLFFASLRPPQMLVAAASMAALLCAAIVR